MQGYGRKAVSDSIEAPETKEPPSVFVPYVVKTRRLLHVVCNSPELTDTYFRVLYFCFPKPVKITVFIYAYIGSF